MVLIYSDKQTSIKGKRIDPKKFSGMPCKTATEVYTDDEKIKSIYEKIGKIVKPLEFKKESNPKENIKQDKE